VKVAHLDPFSGASGDMLLGAIVDVGVALDDILAVLAGLGVEGWRIAASPVVRGKVAATAVRVHVDRDDALVRTWGNVRELVRGASLPEPVRERSLSAFARLTEAEARTAGRSVASMHYSESAAVDAIVDVVGCCAGFHLLGITSLTCSAVAQGLGVVRDEHGLVPVPAPAVLELLRGAPTYTTAEVIELCTPTAAALLAEWADRWGPMPPLTVERVGYGAGSSELDRPNVLRLVVGDAAGGADAVPGVLLSAGLGVLTSGQLAALLARLRDAGATQAWARPLLDGLANDPGRVEVVCVGDRSRAEALAVVLLSDGRAPVVSSQLVGLQRAHREEHATEVAGQRVRVRVQRVGGSLVSVEPDPEDCAAAAAATGLEIAKLAEQARTAWRRGSEPDHPPRPPA
jgi:pyridinium-3,5-bisthiocarboxylic acid mononucleotide nickel chelatase